MIANTYQGIRRQLSSENAFQISNLRGVLTVVVEFIILSAGLICLFNVKAFSVAYWALQFFLSTSLFRMFVILHECGHNTLCRKRNTNTFIGSLVSPFCFLPYVAWRNIHFLHHKWVGVIDKDPTQAHLLNLRDMSRTESVIFKIIWKLWIPVPFMLFVIKVFWFYPYHEWVKGKRSNAVKGLLSLVVCTAPHVVLLLWLGLIQYLVLFAPMIFLFYMIYEIINVPQHSGLFPYVSQTHPQPIPYREQDAITRTTHLPRLLAIGLNYNFNLHVEHHLFPSIPWYSLPKVTEKLDKLSDYEYQRVSFFMFMVDLRREDPLDVYVKSLPSMEVENA